MPGLHARIGPSSLARVRRCPGSVRETQGIARGSTQWAAEGTLLHEIAEACLVLGLDPHWFAGLTMAADGFTFEVTDDMAGCMVPALDWLREQPGMLWVEERVRLDPYMPGQFGTMDVGLYDPATRLATVFDWKFGMGVPVAVKGNEQAQAYGVGFYETILKSGGQMPLRWRFIIEQPRCQGGGRYDEPWEISHGELMNFAGEMVEIWRAANDPDAPLKAGEKQCRFCDAKSRDPAPGHLTGCGTYDDFHLALIDSKFDDIDEQIAGGQPLALPGNLTAERRSFLVRHAGMVEKFFAKLHEDTLRAALAGGYTPGLKAVDGRRGARKWVSDELDAIAVEGLMARALGAKAYVREIKTPAAAEKELAPKRKQKGHPQTWAALQKLVTQDIGKPVLVPEDDERPALKTVDQKFDEEPLEGEE